MLIANHIDTKYLAKAPNFISTRNGETELGSASRSYSVCNKQSLILFVLSNTSDETRTHTLIKEKRIFLLL